MNNMFLNVEIKARCRDAEKLRAILKEKAAVLEGTDKQTDTYFKATKGRLKLRQGNIENNLIQYDRPDQAGPKASNFKLVKVEDAEGLKEALTAAMGVKVIVEKSREIYYIGNVKFHLDTVPALGNFVEIEAGNLLAPELTETQLLDQCRYYMKEFGIEEADLVHHSYSDMLMGM